MKKKGNFQKLRSRERIMINIGTKKEERVDLKIDIEIKIINIRRTIIEEEILQKMIKINKERDKISKEKKEVLHLHILNHQNHQDLKKEIKSQSDNRLEITIINS